MAGQRGQQGRKPRASTIADRERRAGRAASAEGPRRRMPAAPKHLTGEARVEWGRMGKLLRDAGLFDDLDSTALAAYCIAYARHVEAERFLQGAPGLCPNCDPAGDGNLVGRACRAPSHVMAEYGTVVRSRLGALVPSPYLSISRDAMAQMVRLLGEFGMTPASRSRIPREAPAKKPAPRKATVEPETDPRAALGWPALN